VRFKPYLLAVTLSLAAASAAEAQTRTYLCIGDLSTGFVWLADTWKETTFHVRNDRFAVKIEDLEVTVTRIGNDYPSHTCTLYAADATQFACGGLGYGFVMNLTNLRYQDYYGLGYVDGGDSPDNTPALTIGKCSPL
jgi:hypothetical protein